MKQKYFIPPLFVSFCYCILYLNLYLPVCDTVLDVINLVAYVNSTNLTFKVNYIIFSCSTNRSNSCGGCQ